MNSSTDELRGRIISVATELFQKTGLKFTMQEVAASLSISKKTIYTVYPSKEALLLDMIDGLFADIHRKKAELAAQDAPVEERIRKVIVALPEQYSAMDFRLLDELTDALGQRHAAALNADQQQVFHALVVLDDLMRNALDGTAHRRFVHNVSLFAELHGALSFSGKK